MRLARPLTKYHLRGQPGLSRATRDDLLAMQRATVLERSEFVSLGHKHTGAFSYGLITDPEGHYRARTDEELRIDRWRCRERHGVRRWRRRARARFTRSSSSRTAPAGTSCRISRR